MNKSNQDAPWLSVTLDRSARPSLQEQLASTIRHMVRDGRLTSGDRLPASRQLAAELSVSRLTVTTVYDQLMAEGYIVGRRGAGMFVAPDLEGLPEPADRNRSITPLEPTEPIRPFETNSPDLRQFPFDIWARLMDVSWRNPEPALLHRPDPFGWGPLRQAIAAHLYDWRGLRCSAREVVITSGLAEAVEVIAATVLTPGDAVAVEEPGHRALWQALRQNRIQPVPVPVDAAGLRPDAIPEQTRAVSITPSRQFPLGMTMPLARRLAVLNWAQRSGGFVIEDDFDGEYRYSGQPLPALKSLDESGRVIYVGSFSKVLFPGLRLGFVVLPDGRVDRAAAHLAQVGTKAAIIAQPALARFMADGQFSTHLRRMRRLYLQRRKAVLAAIGAECNHILMPPDTAGMHVVARFQPGIDLDDKAFAKRAAAQGVTVRPLSGYYAGPTPDRGLVIGFAGFTEDEIRAAAKILGRIDPM